MVTLGQICFTLASLKVICSLPQPKSDSFDNYKMDRIGVESSQECKTDRDCSVNQFCYGNDFNRFGKCKCEDDFVVHKNETSYMCLQIATGIGSKCVDDIQCFLTLSSSSYCSKNSATCQCKTGSHFVNQQCFTTARLGEFCLVKENCKLADEKYGFCESGKCTCNDNEHPSKDGMRCVRTSHLGDRCNNSESCVSMNAVCMDGICRCHEKYVVTNDQTSCIPIAFELGDHCKQNSQCELIIDSSCIDGFCSCPMGLHAYGNRCYNDRDVGDRCQHKEECIKTSALENSIDCIAGVCSCTIGQSDNIYGCLLDNNGSSYHSSTTLTLYLLALLIGFHAIRK